MPHEESGAYLRADHKNRFGSAAFRRITMQLCVSGLFFPFFFFLQNAVDKILVFCRKVVELFMCCTKGLPLTNYKQQAAFHLIMIDFNWSEIPMIKMRRPLVEWLLWSSSLVDSWKSATLHHTSCPILRDPSVLILFTFFNSQYDQAIYKLGRAVSHAVQFSFSIHNVWLNFTGSSRSNPKPATLRQPQCCAAPTQLTFPRLINIKFPCSLTRLHQYSMN